MKLTRIPALWDARWFASVWQELLGESDTPAGHIAAPDPHSQYATHDDLTTHVGATDPHPDIIDDLTAATTVPDAISEVWANHERLVHALVLLLDSAVTYSPRNSRVCASVTTAGPEVVFRVQQRAGSALPAAKIQELFASRRCDDGGTAEPKGGFRPALCRDIIESHRGRFWIDSGPEQGTVFHVALPAVE